jgi:iron-sulfur cluster insertion protein
MSTTLVDTDLTLTTPAYDKMSELFAQVTEKVIGVRVYATGGGCSGVNFGMTFTEAVHHEDAVREFEAFKVVVDEGTLQYLRGVEIDFVDAGDGNPTFVFNNLPVVSGGCGGGCSSGEKGHDSHDQCGSGAPGSCCSSH